MQCFILKMTFILFLSILTIAILSHNASCQTNIEIEFINDFLNAKISNSIYLETYLCWNKAEIYELSTNIFQNNYRINIHNMENDVIKEFSLAQHIVFLIDLDCKHSTNVLNEANNKNLFAAPYKWLLLTKNFENIENQIEFLSTLNILPDSDVTFAYKSAERTYYLLEIYKYNNQMQYLVRNKLAEWEFEKPLSFPFSFNRRNLNGTLFRSAIVVLNNDTLNHLHDYRQKHIDTVTKANYLFVNYLIDFVNGTRDIFPVSTWGYRDPNTNTIGGMVGTLLRNEAEIGGTPLFLTSDRIPIIEYVAVTTPTIARFVFRQPPLSYVTNIFTLPFTREVWLCSVSLIILTSMLLYLAVFWEWQQPNLEPKENALPKSFLDAVMVIMAAVAQQGATNEPRSSAGKIVMIFTFIALMFLYVSYSANIVALLQTTSTSIQTLEDLYHSRLELGVYDAVYNHYYFKTATEPIQKLIYEKKIVPKGQQPRFMTIEDGVKKMREGFFAFHVEVGSAYKLVSDTFYEHEKCGLQEIAYLKVVDPYVVIKKNSSYKEILKLGFRKIHESGIQSREQRKLYTKKPDCHTSGGQFVSVGIIESYAAFLVLGAGMGFALIIFLLEKALTKIKTK